jgi:death-on-curing protein
VTRYLTLVELLAIHEELLDEFGGAAGVRDPGALEAALFRPQTGYYRDVVHEAAALFESLILNHPFVDGNKRVAFAAADVFLRLNGRVALFDDDETYEFIIGWLSTRSRTLDSIDEWFRSRVQD